MRTWIACSRTCASGPLSRSWGRRAAEPEVLTPPPEPPQRYRWPRVVGLLFVAVGLVCFGSAAVLARLGRPLVATPFNVTVSAGNPEVEPANLRKRAGRAEKELDQLHPKGGYI